MQNYLSSIFKKILAPVTWFIEQIRFHYVTLPKELNRARQLQRALEADFANVSHAPSQFETKIHRLTLDQYFMDIAIAAARRSTCPRKSVGAVIAMDGNFVSSGYNGSPKGAGHCDDVGCLIIDNSCKRTVHAEINAIIFARRDLTGGTCYATLEPCLACTSALINAGIERIVFLESYPKNDTYAKELCRQTGVIYEQLK